MTLTIKYKKGATRKEKVNYLHFEDEFLCFTVDKNPHSAFQEPVHVPLEYVETFDLEK